MAVEEYRPLRSFVKEYAFLVLFFGICCGGPGGGILYDGLTNVRKYIHGTLTVERCDDDTGEIRCTGTFRSEDGGFERAGVTVVDVDPFTTSVDGWLEGPDESELVTEYGDTGNRSESGNWGEWWYHVYFGALMIVLSFAFPGAVMVEAWHTQPARQRRRRDGGSTR